ncbi:MAG: pyridoxal phosphate-dependent aminotransferase [Leptospiraceae bacterium]|nr:pyridoxal phosphate-dependent aminotransferase [Leptospiraceae bacterium]MCK6380449.1 pyridoxal phosphate-dependent aminotransferase [Leptospiraceae bacterium]NUM42184.1 pyridoxal phosphate-dependent aminotransferase [Leptospiraceae bacterium]
MLLQANRLNLVEPSPTLAITAKANALKAEGKDIVGFGAGEPDFDTPVHIKEAAKKAIDSGKTKYTPVSGTVSLKDAIITKFQRENQLKYDRKNIIVGAGGKQVIYNFFMAVLNPKDEVIIPSPYWVSYPDIVKIAEGTPVLVETKSENNFQISPEQLKKAITPKTKVFIFNSPSNPTGAGYSKKDLEALCDILISKDILILSDDIYENLIYDDFQFTNPAMLSEELKEKTFIANCVSKAYSMTGWRIGYGAGNPTIIKNMDTIQGQSTSNACSIAQYAAEEALKGDQSCIKEMLIAFDDRRKKIVNSLNNISEVNCKTPQGAFYVFPEIKKVYELPGFQKLLTGSNESSKSSLFCSYLLEKYEVAAVPGIAFGDDNYIRLSYALGQEAIDKGVSRIAKMISDLKSN